MKRAIKWNKPVEDKGGKVIRTSKCGRYQIITRHMASGRNGYFNCLNFDPLKDGQRIGGRYMQDKLGDAILACEQDNDPNWEPDDS